VGSIMGSMNTLLSMEMITAIPIASKASSANAYSFGSPETLNNVVPPTSIRPIPNLSRSICSNTRWVLASACPVEGGGGGGQFSRDSAILNPLLEKGVDVKSKAMLCGTHRGSSSKEVTVPTHHRIVLALREEPEGHGTLFIGEPEASQTAIALISTEAMNDRIDSSTFEREVMSAISLNLGRVAQSLEAAKIDSLGPIGQDAISEAMQSVASERSVALMSFLAWLADSGYSIFDSGTQVDFDEDLLNGFAEASQVVPKGCHASFPTYSVVLEYFAEWIDKHPKWVMSELGAPEKTHKIAKVVKEYLERVEQFDGNWSV